MRFITQLFKAIYLVILWVTVAIFEQLIKAVLVVVMLRSRYQQGVKQRVKLRRYERMKNDPLAWFTAIKTETTPDVVPPESGLLLTQVERDAIVKRWRTRHMEDIDRMLYAPSYPPSQSGRCSIPGHDRLHGDFVD